MLSHLHKATLRERNVGGLNLDETRELLLLMIVDILAYFLNLSGSGNRGYQLGKVLFEGCDVVDHKEKKILGTLGESKATIVFRI